jgi:hypothetical protein
MIDLLPEIRPLLADDRSTELGPGSPNVAMRSQLQELERLLAPKVKDRASASACLAGLWLYHDFLDESHTISQDLDTAEGSYWHALMHRREPDYWNSKYWFRRVPQHPIFADLIKQAAALTNQAGAPSGSEFLALQAAWDPFAFVDLCESAARRGAEVELLCRRIQRCEWELLFGYCHERAFLKEPRTK